MSPADRLAVEAVERELRHVLSETPSAAFLAGVRRRCVAPQRASAWWLPWCVGGGVAALSIALALAVTSGRTRIQRPAIVRGHAAGAPSLSAPSTKNAVGAQPGGIADNQPKAASAPGTVVIVGRAVSASAHRRTTAAEVEVLVPPGQLEAVRRLVDTLRASSIEAQPMQLAEVVPAVPRLSDIAGAGIITDGRASRIDPGAAESRERNR